MSTIRYGDRVKVVDPESFYFEAEGIVVQGAPGYTVVLTQDKDGKPIPESMQMGYVFYDHHIAKIEPKRMPRRPPRV